MGVATGALASIFAAAVQDRIDAFTASPADIAMRAQLDAGAEPHQLRAPPLPPAPAVVEEPEPLTRAELRGLQLWVLANMDDRLDAPAEVYIAQVHAESRHRCDAVSPAGAVGCGQFLEGAWTDVQGQLPPACRLENGDMRADPICGLIANVLYMRLTGRYARLPGGSDHALRLHAYNAGAGWTKKEIAACAMTPGCDPTSWEGGLEHVCLRSAAACRETAGYVENIMGDYAGQVRDGDIELDVPEPARRRISLGVDAGGQVGARFDWSF